MSMTIRVGVEGGRKPVLERARDLGAPLMVSANSLWDDKRKRFSGWQCYSAFDVALDSGGFVAMKKYGRYRWSPSDYAKLAQSMSPTWWAQMDFCCEPEIAADHRVVQERISMTANSLRELSIIADGNGMMRPLPVLQGWMPADYCGGPIYESSDWPAMVGVGSVCRRHIEGRDGIMAVVEAIDRAIPPSVQLHLFGVKSSSIIRLRQEFPDRVTSMDSMAWNIQARWDAYNGGRSCTGVDRAAAMSKWYEQQTASIAEAGRQPLLSFK